MKYSRLSKLFSGIGQPRKRTVRSTRRASFEPLEARQLLSITMGTIADQVVLAGAPLALPVSGTNSTGNNIIYTTTVSNATWTTSTVSNPQLTASVNNGNPTLVLQIDDNVDNIHGTLKLELFKDLAPDTVDKIMTLVNSNYYDGLTFHRIIENFMIQGGDPNGNGTGGPGYKFDDEFTSDLQFTSSGVLAMANSGSDTNGSQFFITTSNYRAGDFKYTIFGRLTEGADLLNQLDSVQTNSSNKPLNTVKITDASIIYNDDDGVVRLSAPNGVTGAATVTVTATDAVTGESVSQAFHVTVSADTTNNPPFLGDIPPVVTTANTPIVVTLPATDVEGNSIYYNANVGTSSVVGTSPNLSVSVNHSTGQVTVTPLNNVPGVYYMFVSAAATSSSALDSQVVPIYVNPAAPTSISLALGSDTGSNISDKLTSLNNSENKPLKFNVNGVVSGALVELYCDGVLIGSATADSTSTSVAITTNQSAGIIADGAHSITAKQTLVDKTVVAGNYKTEVDLGSATSTALTVTIDATIPDFDFTETAAAVIGLPYACRVAVTGNDSGMRYELIAPPTNMTINAETGLIAWTPANGTASSVTVTIRATDSAGNKAQCEFAVAVRATNAAPVLETAAPSIGTTDEETVVNFNLSSLINGSSGTTKISDADADEVGGIALVGITNNGVWQYSLDGANYTTIASVSASSALLLPANAKLRFTPDGKNGGTASITYHAWDASSLISGVTADLSATTAVGGSTSYSELADTATLAVASLNDAPVLAPVSKSQTPHTSSSPTTVAVSALIGSASGITGVSDADSNAVLGGMAIVATSDGGTWDFTLDGENFTAMGVVSQDSAILLPSTASIRYTPGSTNTGAASLSYRAWDATSGAAGERADTTTNGGATAFSAQSDTMTLPINDAPVLVAVNPSLGATTEDVAITVDLTSFIRSASGTAITDPNSNAVLGGIAITGITNNGTWAYSLDGTTYTTISGVSSSSALLLPSTAKLRYTPDSKAAETPTITYHAWDTTTGTAGAKVDLSASGAVGGATAFSQATDTASLAVTNVNDASVLTAVSPSLGTLTTDSATVIALTTLVNNGSTATKITDVDPSAVIGGIALTGTTGSGVWAYSLDGTTYTNVGTVSTSSALLLPSTAKLRYTPITDENGTAKIGYCAWDTTSGTAGSHADTSTNGGVTAFSAVSDTATLAVATATASITGYVYADVNDDGLRTASNGQPHAAIPGVVVTLFVKANDGVWTSDNSTITAADGSYSFTKLAAGTYRIVESQPDGYLDGKETVGLVGSSASGTAGSDEFTGVVLTYGVNATEYNFGEQGLKVSSSWANLFLASTILSSETPANSAPVVSPNGTASGVYAATFTSGGSAVAIAATTATITDLDSAKLAKMTVTIADLKNGDLEKLAVDLSNTNLKSTFASGLLTITGAADVATYQKVLRSITYSNTASSPTLGARTLQIIGSDGIANSTTATVTISVAAAASATSAFDAALEDEDLLSE